MGEKKAPSHTDMPVSDILATRFFNFFRTPLLSRELFAPTSVCQVLVSNGMGSIEMVRPQRFAAPSNKGKPNSLRTRFASASDTSYSRIE